MTNFQLDGLVLSQTQHQTVLKVGIADVCTGRLSFGELG